MEDDEEEEEPRYISFSGHGEGPEAYLRWETEMDSLFRFHNIPKEERLSQAVSSLVGEASTWWINDEARSYYYKPVTNWGNLKQRMYKEFVQRLHNRSYTPKRLMFQATTNVVKQPVRKKYVLPNTHTRRTTTAKPVVPAKETHMPSSLHGVVPKPNPTSLDAKGMETQGKSSNSLKLKEPTCYRCHKKGHYAAVCPDRQVVTTLESKLDSSHSSECLVQSSCEISDSRLMHLSCPKVVQAGLGRDMESQFKMSQPALEKDGVANIFTSVREEPPDRMMTSYSVVHAATGLNHGSNQVSYHVIPFVSNDPKTVIKYLMGSEELEKGLGTMEQQAEPPNSQAYTRGGTNGETESEITNFTRKNTFLPQENDTKSWRRVIMSLLIKEEPPDAGLRSYPGYTQAQTRGNFLNPLVMPNTNLLYLCAGDQVLRSKLFEEGGYDAVINTRTKPEQPWSTAVRYKPLDTEPNGSYNAKLHSIRTKLPRLGIHQTIHALEDCGRARTQLARSDLEMAHQGPSKAVAEDMHPLKGGHQPAQKDFGNETTWSTILTHQAITANLNQTKRSSHEEDIQLSSWVNLDLPDLDTRALNGGFQPNQEELRCKPNWSMILIPIGNYGGWIHTNPNSDVKVIQLSRQRIIHLPYLESHELMRHQTYPWHPGDLKMHLGASRHVLSCTSTQRIRRIHPHFNFPFPDVFTPCAFKEFAQQLLKYTQRLFGPDSCILDVIKAIQKVPRKLTYPSKPSRYKAPSTSSSSWPICSLSRLTASFALIA